MILILSELTDISTTNVCILLKKQNISFEIITADNFKSHLFIDFVEDTILLKGKQIDYKNIKVVWNRRWRKEIGDIDKENIQIDIHKHKEFLELSNYLEHKLSEAFWIDPFEAINIPKLIQLDIAKNVGLKIPISIITTEKQDLILFKKQHNKIITKPLKSFNGLTVNENSYFAYTALVDDISQVPEKFAPSLFQEYIEKKFEIRSFYWFGALYSVIYYSQNNKRTEIDYREYDFKNPNRISKYKLPKDIEEKIKCFCKKCKLNSGSFDFIMTPQNELCFLEVNTVGQYAIITREYEELNNIISNTLIQYGRK